MTAYAWTTGTSGLWTTTLAWSIDVVPNDPAADVTIDATAPPGGSYVVTISSGQSISIRSLSLNGSRNLAGSRAQKYNAAELDINGILTFATGSIGELDGSSQTHVVINNGTIVNAGTLNGIIQGEGNVLITGTNGFYVPNQLQALAGTVTVDTTSISEISGSTLVNGTYVARGDGASINLGGTLERLAVDVTTIEGPPAAQNGSAELILDGISTEIFEWNGTSYKGLETTLRDIEGRGTLDVLGGRSYASGTTLTVGSGGMLNLQSDIFTTAGLEINGGVVQGFATIRGGVFNNGTLCATGGTLDVIGSLTGTGVDTFDFDQRAGTLDTTGATLEVYSVSAGQTIIMNGDDTLRLDTPNAFEGTIEAKVGDSIVLQGLTATSANASNGVLTVSDTGHVVATLAISGADTGDTFKITQAADGATISIQPPLPIVTYRWVSGTSGAWSNTANWDAAVIPNGDLAAVVIDAAPGAGAYIVTIAPRTADTVASLSLNTQTNAGGTRQVPYDAAVLAVEGTLSFAPGGSGAIDGPAQSRVALNGGTIVNAGLVNAIIQADGNDLITGTNGFNAAGGLLSLGTTTVDTASIAGLNDDTLSGGVFEANSPGATIKLGGPAQGLIVNIATIDGSPLFAGGNTNLALNAPGAAIDTWNGVSYVPVEQSLSVIAGVGTLAVLGGRDYITANHLTVAGNGALLLDAGTLTTGGITVQAGGRMQGAATIATSVANNGSLVTSGSGLILRQAVTGTGQINFATAGGTLEVGAVDSGQSITSAGRETIVFDDPNAFAGTLSAQLGDLFVLPGIVATSAALEGSSLVIRNGAQHVASLALSGSYTSDSFGLSAADGRTEISLTAQAPIPSIIGLPASVTGPDTAELAPFATVSVSVPDPGDTVGLRISLTNGAVATDADGVLSGSGLTRIDTGTYNLAATSPAKLNGELQALIFTPTLQQVAAGGSVDTRFDLVAVEDGAEATASTNVIITAAQPVPSNFAVEDTTTGQTTTVSGVAYNGPVAGLKYQYIDVTADNLAITAVAPNAFIHTGSGDDAIDVSKSGGTNVLDGGTGSNFLVGGTGNDTFFVDDRVAPADIWSTVSNFHVGDAATVYGVAPSTFTLDWEDDQGTPGFTGLTLHATAPGMPIASMTLVGYSKTDLTNGRLSVSFGNDPASASNYMYVHAN